MKKKTIVTSILATALCTCAMFGVAACGNDNGEEKEKPSNQAADITNGIYDGTYKPSGSPYTQESYFRFHKTGDVFDGKQTFYFYALSTNGTATQYVCQPMFGIYEVLDEQITMKAFESGSVRYLDGTTPKELTADKTVVLKTLDGETELMRTGWDTTNDRLLGIPFPDADNGITATNGFGITTGNTNYCYLHSTEAKEDKGIALYTFYCDTDDVRNASITIYHNNTYTDDRVTSAASVNGTYTVSGSTYTLTAGTGATGGSLVIGNNGATFTPTDGTAVTMSTSRNRELLEGWTFTGTGTLPGMSSEVTLTLKLYDDNSAVLEGMGKPAEYQWTAGEDGNPESIQVPGSEDVYIEMTTDTAGENYWYYLELSGITCKTESAAVEVLYTLKGNTIGKDQQGNDTTVTYTLTLTNVYTFDLNYQGALSAASGSWKVLTTGPNAGKYELTVAKTFSNMFAVDSKILVTVTYNSDYTAVEQLTAEIPAVSAMMIQAAPIKMVVHELKGSFFSGNLKMSLKLLADGTAIYEASGAATQHGEGTWTETEGKPVSATVNETTAGLGELTFTITENNGEFETVVNGNTLTTATPEA